MNSTGKSKLLSTKKVKMISAGGAGKMNTTQIKGTGASGKVSASWGKPRSNGLLPAKRA